MRLQEIVRKFCYRRRPTGDYDVRLYNITLVLYSVSKIGFKFSNSKLMLKAWFRVKIKLL